MAKRDTYINISQFSDTQQRVKMSKKRGRIMVEKTNLKEQVNSVSELFSYFKVGQLNDHMLNVLQAENRTLDFHVHNQSDEMFYCIEGEFDIELMTV